jgi:hypothetical protein
LLWRIPEAINLGFFSKHLGKVISAYLYEEEIFEEEKASRLGVIDIERPSIL